MKLDNKAVSSSLVILVIIILIVGVIAALALSGSTIPQKATVLKPVTVQIDGVDVDWLDTATPIQWGELSLGNAYSRNFTVINTANITLTCTLFTNEPPGTTQNWVSFNKADLNGTAIVGHRNITGLLLLNVNVVPDYGEYTWQLTVQTGNGTGVFPTPTPTASVSPTPTSNPAVTRQCIVKSTTGGIQSLLVNITNYENAVVTYTQTQLIQGQTFSFHEGDTIRFTTITASGYTFNGYLVNGLNTYIQNPYEQSFTGDFSIDARAQAGT